MESRTRLAIGGMATVAASVTVICIVALTNSLALSESAGSSVGAAPIVVPASDSVAPDDSSTPSATPRVTPSPEPEPRDPVAEDPVEPGESGPVAEVVPAPDAQVVTPVRPSPAAETPRPSSPATVEEAIAEAEASGSWDPVRAWAERQGWSAGRIDALIKKLERARADYRTELESERTTAGSDSGRLQAPPQDDGDRGAGAGSSPGHRATADEKANRRTEKSGHGSQKDRGNSSRQRDR